MCFLLLDGSVIKFFDINSGADKNMENDEKKHRKIRKKIENETR